jgi:trehalose-6-phosphate synthase
MDTLLSLTAAVLLAALFALRRTFRSQEEERRRLSQRLAEAKERSEFEARLRVLGDPLWTPERLREHVRIKLRGRPLVVVSNREPYRHTLKSGGVECDMPASGLVTALEPVLRACGGTWVAHGDGSGDRQAADERGRLHVPPGQPEFTLRRVWLSREEELGYYDGFANEGLWPLCHIAHTRPVFRAEDWVYYSAVNMKFASAVLEEIQGLEEPLLLVQDYHFTLLPKLLKEARPDARVALFWHIPWPNSEAFGICPWQNELLEGMLGADLIGFHTQYHCNNFVDTVDSALESRVDREQFAIERGEHATLVRPFPISVGFPSESASPPAGGAKDRLALREKFGVRAEFIAVGVDRLDYTKGILERFQAVERFLDLNPQYRGRFTLLQIAAASRTEIAKYKEFGAQVEAEARRINARLRGAGAPPIVLSPGRPRAELTEIYRASDACLVTSLHDGMNLVAKEFVAARDDERGVLILSRFTGAARELDDALIVNPYDVNGVAEAIRQAMEMGENEQLLRMVRLRRVVRENNAYRWAGHLIEDLSAIRLPSANTIHAPIHPSYPV